ncbi:MAG: TorD/DmsD family molecular chaperone [Planctomycetota bacterium]|jgi:nitrate reductase assembly molybdenum cofactor insertion protein NarJ
MVGIAEQRAAAYKLLSLCFHPPDEGLLEVLREADLQGLCPNSLPALDELRKDHTQLFVGPFRVPAPPYGSVYLEDDGRVCGESTMDMIARYGEEGLRVTLKEPADHVAIELEYMYLLVVRQMEATDAPRGVDAHAERADRRERAYGVLQARGIGHRFLRQPGSGSLLRPDLALCLRRDREGALLKSSTTSSSWVGGHERSAFPRRGFVPTVGEGRSLRT